MDLVSNYAIQQSASDLDHKLTIELTQVLAKCYGEGFVKAAEALEAKPHVKPDDSFRLSQDVERLVKPMKDYNAALADRVSAIVQEGFDSEKDDIQIATELREKIPSLLNNEPLTIQRPGKRPVSFTAEGYANMVAGIIPYSVRANGYVRGLEESGADGWQWVATEDERMCEVCGSLHGQVFGFETQFELPHPGCRCRPIANFKPKTEEEEAESERISEKAKEKPWEITGEGTEEELDSDQVSKDLIEPIYPSRYVYPGSTIERPKLEHKILDVDKSNTLNRILTKQTGQESFSLSGDEYLHSLANELGYDSLPTVVSKQEMDAIVSNGHLELFRGVMDKKYAESFLHGEYFAGTGIQGNGTYTAYGANGLKIATSYGQESIGGKVIRMALDKEAKVIKSDILAQEMKSHISQLENELKDKTASLMNELNTIGDINTYPNRVKSTYAEIDELKKEFGIKRMLLNEPGRFATLQGYDAIDVDGLKYMIVLNRKALYVEALG
jgi:hypothetical protein